MSKTTKRKHVTREALDEYYVPEGEEEIVKVIGGRGNNLHEVESADGKKFLVSMPTKFRKNLWIKRGDFVVIIPIKEGNKVLAEIVSVLYPKQIKYLQDEKLWPDVFMEKSKNDEFKENELHRQAEHFSSCSEDEDDMLFRNPNRREFIHAEESESETGEDESEDDDGISEGSVEHDSQVNGTELEAEMCNRLKFT